MGEGQGGYEVRQLWHVSGSLFLPWVYLTMSCSTRRYDSGPFYPKTEKEVFDLFGLEWVDPIYRNADV